MEEHSNSMVELIDILYNNNNDNNHPSKESSSSMAFCYRCRRQDSSNTVNDNNISRKTNVETFDSQQEQRAKKAAEMTVRWCRNFVAQLNLCPWAQASLDNENAIRIKVIIPHRWKDVEKCVKESALELIELTGGDDDDDDDDNDTVAVVDPNVAISFVIVLPHSDIEDDEDEAYEFVNFYNMVLDLEELLLDEMENVIIAPFHPQWTFASNEEEERESSEQEDDHDEMNKNVLDYEKKSPYPTISIVRTSVILKAGQQATENIKRHNEDVLTTYGTHALERLFRQEVLDSDR